MFGISFPELMVIVVLILVVMGPEKIPDVARTLGKVMREVRRASNMMRDTLMIDEDEYQRNRARRVRQVEREAERNNAVSVGNHGGNAGDDAGDPVVAKRASSAGSTLGETLPGRMMPGGSLDQVDDEMLTASFEAALSEMYDLPEGGVREVRIAPRRTDGSGQSEGEHCRAVELAEQGAAPGCRDVHLTVGAPSNASSASNSEVAG